MTNPPYVKNQVKCATCNSDHYWDPLNSDDGCTEADECDASHKYCKKCALIDSKLTCIGECIDDEAIFKVRGECVHKKDTDGCTEIEGC